MASSGAANLSKTQQYSQRRFAESSPKTLVGLHKSEVQLKKMIDTLEQQQNTAVNNIANHQQAMKMSWRRLEERRSTSPLMTSREKRNEQAKNSRKGMLLQSNTRLYVDKTPEIYSNTESLQGPDAAASHNGLGERRSTVSAGGPRQGEN